MKDAFDEYDAIYQSRGEGMSDTVTEIITDCIEEFTCLYCKQTFITMVREYVQHDCNQGIGDD